VVGPGGCISIIIRTIKQIQIAPPGFNSPNLIKVEFEIGEDLRNFYLEIFRSYAGKTQSLGMRIVLSRLQFPLSLIAAEGDQGCQETDDTENNERNLQLKPDRELPDFIGTYPISEKTENRNPQIEAEKAKNMISPSTQRLVQY